MKNRTLVLLLFLVVLITAFAFRWVEGPIQADNKLEIVHLKDRWTGQAWIQWYGTDASGNFYSGQMEPYFEQNKIDKKARKYISKLTRQRMEYLESEILKQNKIKVDNAVGYAQWMRLSSEYGAEFDANNPIRRVTPTGNNPRQERQAMLDELSVEVERIEARNKYLDSKIPNELKEQGKAWENANHQVEKYKAEIGNNSKSWVKDASITKAKEALTRKAFIIRYAGTVIWIVLLVLTIALILRGVSNSRSQKEPFKYYGR